MTRLQRRARLESELLRQVRADSLVGAECITLASGPVQRKHQLLSHALARGMLGREPLELADQRGVVAQLKLGIDPRLEGDEAQLFKSADLGLGEILERHLGQWRASPQGQRLAQQSRGAFGLPGGEHPPPLFQTRLEHVGVELAVSDREQVPAVNAAQRRR